MVKKKNQDVRKEKGNQRKPDLKRHISKHCQRLRNLKRKVDKIYDNFFLLSTVRQREIFPINTNYK